MTDRNDVEALATALEAMAGVLSGHAPRLRGSAQIVRLALEGEGEFAGIPSAEAMVAVQVRQVLDIPELRLHADEAIAAAKRVESDPA